MVKILDVFFILAFSLKMVGKMLKFARKFIDLRVKQKILFEYGLQIWFFCNLTIGWLSKFPAAHLYAPPKNLSTPWLASSFIHFSNKFNNINILFLHFFFIQLKSFQFSKVLPRSRIRLMLQNVTRSLTVIRSFNFITNVLLVVWYK